MTDKERIQKYIGGLDQKAGLLKWNFVGTNAKCYTFSLKTKQNNFTNTKLPKVVSLDSESSEKDLCILVDCKVLLEDKKLTDLGLH